MVNELGLSVGTVVVERVDGLRSDGLVLETFVE